MPDDAKTFMVEDARIIFLNFTGKEAPFNREGDRNFAVVLNDEAAEAMLADGWNVKYLDPRDEGDAPTPYIQVAVSFKNRPPRIVLLANEGKTRTQLDEKSVGIVDNIDIKLVDLICRGYEWVVNDKSGVKAYLQSMFITVNEDALERKYKINEHPPTDD